jgi:hypothetical protein
MEKMSGTMNIGSDRSGDIPNHTAEGNFALHDLVDKAVLESELRVYDPRFLEKLSLSLKPVLCTKMFSPHLMSSSNCIGNCCRVST